MTYLDHHRRELQVSQDEIMRLRQLVSSKDSIIKDLCASKKLVAQELEAARLATKVAEDKCATLKAQRDKAMDKAICAG
jgi:Mg2+ and Co2+ transporter CorA